jgi:uncharacterized OsmC-like protein
VYRVIRTDRDGHGLRGVADEAGARPALASRAWIAITATLPQETHMPTTTISPVEGSVARFTADPEAGRAQPAVTAELANGRARLSSGPFNWDADLGLAIGGSNLAPSPTAYLLGALAGCAAVFLADTLAPLYGVTVDGVSATARCSSDAAGLLGIDGRDPALGEIQLDVVVSSPDPAERLEPVFAAWRERCPIYLALLRPNAISLSFAMDGEPTAQKGAPV